MCGNVRIKAAFLVFLYFFVDVGFFAKKTKCPQYPQLLYYLYDTTDFQLQITNLNISFVQLEMIPGMTQIKMLASPK